MDILVVAVVVLERNKELHTVMVEKVAVVMVEETH